MNIKDLQLSLDTSGKIVRDECGNQNIFGSKGKVFIGEPFWFIFIGQTRNWNSIKKQLSFMTLFQDGDDEGILKLDRYPTLEEARLLRKICGLTKKKKLSPAHLVALIQHGSTSQFPDR